MLKKSGKYKSVKDFFYEFYFLFKIPAKRNTKRIGQKSLVQTI